MPNIRVVASPKGVATSESLAAQLSRDSHVVLPARRSVGRLGMTRNRQCISETPHYCLTDEASIGDSTHLTAHIPPMYKLATRTIMSASYVTNAIVATHPDGGGGCAVRVQWHTAA